MPNPDKTFWRYVHQKPSYKFNTGKSQFFPLSFVPVILYRKSNVFIVHTDDAVIADGNPMGILAGGITTAFALLLLPLIFIPNGNEPLDMAGVWTGVVLLLILLGFGLILLFRLHKEPEETQQPIVIVREQKMVAVLGIIQWGLSLVMMLTAVIVAGTPPFDAAFTFVITLIGLPFMLLGVWMLLARRNRTLFVFRDNSMWYISSWGRNGNLRRGR